MGFWSQNLSFRGQDDRTQARIQVFLPDKAHFTWFWAILPGFGQFWADLDHYARIWAIHLDLGTKGDEAKGGAGGGCTDGRTDGRTDSPCVLQDFVPFGAAAQKYSSGQKQLR